MMLSIIFGIKFWIGITCGFLIYLIIKWLVNTKKEPPGPYGLPIVGYLPFLGMKMNLTLTKLAEKYGNVYQIRLGSQKIVVVNYQAAIREVTSRTGHEFAGRPDFYTYRTGFGAFGIPGYPPNARLYKKLTMKAMSVFTTDRKVELQEVAYRAVDMLLDEFKNSEGKAVEPKMILYRVVWTIMGYICYGRYFNKDDPEVDRVFENVDSFAKIMMFGVAIDYFPWAKFLLGKQLKRYRTLMSTLDGYSKRLSEENLRSYDPNAENPIRNFADMFREAGNEMTDEEKQYLSVNNETLKEAVSSIFGAGFGTIAAMTRWAMMFLAKHNDVQSKCQDELDKVIGRNHYPDFDGVKNLPYTNATMTEIYRAASMAALGITHAATKGTTLAGYDIAEGTPIVLNLWSAHRDPKYFKDADSFDPERFLHEDGSLNKAAVETVIPFGLGARRCGGEPVARLEVFLFFAAILQRCNIIEDPEHPLDPTKYIMGLGLELAPFKVIFKERKR